MNRGINFTHSDLKRSYWLDSEVWENVSLPDRTRKPPGWEFRRIITRSPLMKAALDRAARAAFTHTTVLLRGASGVGKELVAQSIHNASSRAEQPFIPVNCAAIPSELFESELFGHERGAFTGAASCKAGWFELADGGTLFLDEIGDLPMSLQGKLLRVLQDGTFYRVGGTKPMKSDVRILAATNQNLEAKIRDGAFREDLYYRLNVITISLPALCERPEDIPILVEYFLKKYSMGTGRAKSGATPRAMQILMNYQWPGNVRELENTIEHAVVLGNSEIVDVDDLPSHLIDNDASSAFKSSLSLEDAQRQFKKRYISRVLRQTGGNRTQAAKILQIERTYLSRLISNLDIAVS